MFWATKEAESYEKGPTSPVDAREQGVNVKAGVTYSVAFLPNGKDVLSGGREEKIQRWRGTDGQEVGKAMSTKGYVLNIATSSNGKWIATGTHTGVVTVWDAETRERVMDIKAHEKRVFGVDVSPDCTTIATGSEDKSACTWSLGTGTLVVGPLKHEGWLAAVKYSPRGDLLATATWDRKSVRIYDGQNGRLLLDVPVKVTSHINQSLAWSTDGQQLYALAREGRVHCLDARTGTTLWQWYVHANLNGTGCISIARNGLFMATSTKSSISFWDTRTRKQIGRVIDLYERTDTLWTLSVSPDSNILAYGGSGKTVVLQSLEPILPESYLVRPGDGNGDSKLDGANLFVENAGRRVLPKDVITKLSEAQLHSQLAEALHTAILLEPEVTRTENASGLFHGLAGNASSGDWSIDLVTTFEKTGDAAVAADKTDEAIAAYATALSLSPPVFAPLLRKWTRVMVTRCASWKGVLSAATEFTFPPFSVYQSICDALEETGRVEETAECFQQMNINDRAIDDQQSRWSLDFGRRCAERLERTGDAAMGVKKYGEAAKRYSTALTLDPSNAYDMLLKRSEARVHMGLWQGALDDADEAIIRDPSCPRGYEKRQRALCGAGRRHIDTTALKTARWDAS